MRKPYCLLLLAVVVLAVACRQALPEDRLVDLLTDMYLYDEELARGIPGADSVSVYRSVFIRHGCSEEEYKKTIARYAEKPKAMKEIYEAVKARLEGYKAVFEHEAQLEDYMRDTARSSYDTLLYIALESDSAAQRHVYLPKFRVQCERHDEPAPLDKLALPARSIRPAQPVEHKQHLL
jgi:hypothetical protein